MGAGTIGAITGNNGEMGKWVVGDGWTAVGGGVGVWVKGLSVTDDRRTMQTVGNIKLT